MPRSRFAFELTAALLVTVVAAASPASSAWNDFYNFEPKGTLAFWSMDGDAADISGNGLAGLVAHASPVTGKFGQALAFNGTDSIMQVGDYAESRLLTLSAWIRIDRYSGNSQVLLHREAGDQSHRLTLEDGVVRFTVQRGDQPPNSAVAPNPVPAFQWVHVAVTTDAWRTKIYLNGQRVADERSAGPPLYGNSVFATAIGGHPAAGERFEGAIDDVAVFDRVLSPAEIAALSADGDASGIADFWESNLTGFLRHEISRVHENYNDGDYTNGLTWEPNTSGNSPAGSVTVNNGRLHFRRTQAAASGSVSLNLDTNIPLTDSVVLALDARVDSRSLPGCGAGCEEHPLMVTLLCKDSEGRDFNVRYDFNVYGAAQDRTAADSRVYGFDLVQGEWTRGLRFYPKQAWPNAGRIVKVILHASGENFEAWIDNLRLYEEMIHENFNDGSFSTNPPWFTYYKRGAIAGNQEVVGGTLHHLRTGSGDTGGSVSLWRETSVPVTENTWLSFDVRVVARSLEGSPTDLPAIVALFMTRADGTQVLGVFGANYGPVQDSQPNSIQRFDVEQIPPDAWVRDLRWRIRDVWPDAVQVNTITVNSGGWDYDTYIDNVTVRDHPVVSLAGDVDMEFVQVPAGSLLMGSTDSEDWSWCYPCEQPRQQVAIPYSFLLTRFEVTQDQWQAVTGSNPSFFSGCGGDCPVEMVSFNMILNYIGQLNNLGIGTFRLPSESEWEYAARAGTSTRYYWGEGTCNPGDCNFCDLDDYAWWCANSDSRTHPVGEKIPNAFGLYDMAGNVQEFVADDWHPTLDGIPLDGSPWIGTPRTSLRSLRSGRWNAGTNDHRSANRDRAGLTEQDDNIGFRLVFIPDRNLYGDVNCDGVVDIADLQQLADLETGIRQAVDCPENADVNCDGAIDLADVLLVGQYLSGLEPVLPKCAGENGN